jgi:TrmH family RNA methyltransferase
MITSLANDKIKLTRALAHRRTRWRERSFILEGVRLLSEAAIRGVNPRFVLHTTAGAQKGDVAHLIDSLAQRGVPCHLVSEEVMVACTDTVTPPGLLAVMPFPEVPTSTHPTWTLVVDNVRTPGNLGTILRTAAAAGVDQVLLSPGTVDPYNPKVVRGAAGAHFCLPMLCFAWDEIAARLAGLFVWHAVVEGSLLYTAADWTRPLALIVSGEAGGASPKALALADASVRIPMARDIESLNVAVAAGVLLFEIARQRHDAGRTLT